QRPDAGSGDERRESDEHPDHRRPAALADRNAEQARVPGQVRGEDAEGEVADGVQVPGRAAEEEHQPAAGDSGLTADGAHGVHGLPAIYAGAGWGRTSWRMPVSGIRTQCGRLFIS